eukprot:120189-Pyramimonas_sp.AAC.1
MPPDTPQCTRPAVALPGTRHPVGCRGGALTWMAAEARTAQPPRVPPSGEGIAVSQTPWKPRLRTRCCRLATLSSPAWCSWTRTTWASNELASSRSRAPYDDTLVVATNPLTAARQSSAGGLDSGPSASR